MSGAYGTAWMVVYRMPGEKWQIYDTCLGDPDDARARVKNCHDRHPGLEECEVVRGGIKVDSEDVSGA